jgi:hypothetical protein
LRGNEANLANLRKLDFFLVRPKVSRQTFLALVRYSKVQDFENFGRFIFTNKELVI